jgi:hypothetical protein
LSPVKAASKAKWRPAAAGVRAAETAWALALISLTLDEVDAAELLRSSIRGDAKIVSLSASIIVDARSVAMFGAVRMFGASVAAAAGGEGDPNPLGPDAPVAETGGAAAAAPSGSVPRQMLRLGRWPALLAR